MARVHRGEKVQHMCLVCVHGQECVDKHEQEMRDWLRNYWVGGSPTDAQYEQLPLALEEPVALVTTQVYAANVTPQLVDALLARPDMIYELSPHVFEELICDRLQAMNLGVERVGGHTYQKDGGIDIVAWPLATPFPFLMAIQAKHHRLSQRKTGPGPVRDLLGIVHTHPFSAGVLVTNTTFTPDAEWIAEQMPMLVHLRDIHDIERWLSDNFLDEEDWREMPNKITVCPGVVVRIPWAIGH
jgi:hypothetical protein